MKTLSEERIREIATKEPTLDAIQIEMCIRAITISLSEQREAIADWLEHDINLSNINSNPEDSYASCAEAAKQLRDK